MLYLHFTSRNCKMKAMKGCQVIQVYLWMTYQNTIMVI
jgi:hypothetical protein